LAPEWLITRKKFDDTTASFGNWLATTLMSFSAKFTDLGPFRAIKYNKLLALNMEDKTYGWTVKCS
jgi:hypothetical protein